ncbi:MAG: pilus assembly protein [Phenylobacterium sp.]|uniref:TadE/TadG family type IV pilus assembly protein n=1 Tax=Phenylobacterium sp. TaxID=1871053 RepID=UPI002734B5D1|nr:TadE family protein [Phenylobacterium sp.]MDP3173182.1 pilus assembly protein [Phenylobacterium sp.]
MGRSRHAFLASERGSGSVEFALVGLIFVAMMVGIVDMGRLAFEINRAKAATRAGARYAVVNPMVSMEMRKDWSAESGGNGLPVPIASVPTITCNSAGCSTGASDATVFTAIVTRMQVFDPALQASNVEVVYEHVGLGVVGNPYAPDVEPLVTVRLTGLRFAPGALQIFGRPTLTLPSMTTTLSGEDLN